MRVAPSLILVSLLAACSGGPPPPPPPPAPPPPPTPTVFDDQLKTLDKAKAVQGDVLEQKDRLDDAIDEQGN